jgi:hypothetical protein
MTAPFFHHLLPMSGIPEISRSKAAKVRVGRGDDMSVIGILRSNCYERVERVRVRPRKGLLSIWSQESGHGSRDQLMRLSIGGLEQGGNEARDIMVTISPLFGHCFQDHLVEISREMRIQL